MVKAKKNIEIDDINKRKYIDTYLNLVLIYNFFILTMIAN